MRHVSCCGLLLQETELERTNEYISAMKAHTAYFDSEDVVKFMLHHVVDVDGPSTTGPS
jgi:DDHD domain.